MTRQLSQLAFLLLPPPQTETSDGKEDFSVFSLPFEVRAQFFLELHGSIKITSKCQEFFDKLIVPTVSTIVTGSPSRKVEKWNPFVSLFPSICKLRHLKYKHRDYVESCVLSCRGTTNKLRHFAEGSHRAGESMEKCFNERLRLYYGIRYDERANLYDWDYQMKWKERGVGRSSTEMVKILEDHDSCSDSQDNELVSSPYSPLLSPDEQILLEQCDEKKAPLPTEMWGHPVLYNEFREKGI
ncbi:Dynein assembly factor 3, axonemal like protein, partial [Aduncisulcus paluster]